MENLAADRLLKNLKTRVLGKNAIFFSETDSTNSEARRLLQRGCPDGSVIIADSQTDGRGRRGRRWVSESGSGLWMTVLIEPFMPLGELQKLSLLAGFAVCRAVTQVTGGVIEPMIKWPNDVMVRDGKLCGILCESAVGCTGKRWVLIGIGVNIKTPDAGYGDAENVAVSLERAAGLVIDSMELAAVILHYMEISLDGWRVDGFSTVAKGYREYMLPVGSPVCIIDGEQHRQGLIEGLDDDGELLVRLETGGVERVISGEISVRGVTNDVQG